MAIDKTTEEELRQRAIAANEEKRAELEKRAPSQGPGLDPEQTEERKRSLKWQGARDTMRSGT